MKEYKLISYWRSKGMPYNGYGLDEDPAVRLVMEEEGYSIQAEADGSVRVYGPQNGLLGAVGPCGGPYRQVSATLEPQTLKVWFLHRETVDHYPDCDGEYDRWSERLVEDRVIALDRESNTVTVLDCHERED